MALPGMSAPPEPESLAATRPIHRWLALAAALMAWGFDGVEQGVYSIMTRQALKDLVPDVSALCARAAALQATLADSARVSPELQALTRQIDAQIGPYFSFSVAMWLWGAAVGGILFGRLGDRYGRARMLLFSVATYSLFTGLSALVHGSPSFMACRFLGAIGLGGTWPLCVALVVETWPEKNRAMLAGAIGAAANAGYLLAATYSRVMLHWGYGWRGIIATGMGIALLSLPVIALVHEPVQWKRTRDRAARARLSDLFSPALRRSTIVGSLLSTVALLGTWGSFLWLPTFVDQLAEHTAYAGNAKAIVTQWQSLGQIAGGFMGGLLAGWLGNRRTWILLCITAYISVSCLFGFMTHFTWSLIVMATIAGLFVTAFFGWLPKYLPELYPTHIRASGQGFAYNIGRVLTGFGVLGTGQLVAFFEGSYAKGAMVIAGVYLLGLVVIQFAPDTGGRMKAEQPETP